MPALLLNSPRINRRTCRPLLFLAVSFLAVLLFRHLPYFTSFEWSGPDPEGRPTQIPQPSRPPVISQTSQPPASHLYRSDGLLEVNQDGAHPIFELIERAENQWNSKLRKASYTLEEAVTEYVKRYHRLPPKGFDSWWNYVARHDIQLPDEYDSIYHSLEPFWGVDPVDLQGIQFDWEKKQAAYSITIGKVDGGPLQILKNSMPVHVDNKNGHEARIMQRIDLMKDIEHMLPDFRATFSPFDNPDLVRDWELESLALDAAAARTYIDIENLPSGKTGWLSACKPGTPARQNPPNLLAPLPTDLPSRHPKTFIHDHRLAMDPCLHPRHLQLVGQFLSHNQGPNPHRSIIPHFSSCATLLHADLLPVPPEGSAEDAAGRAWAKKRDERLLWRGSNTGMMHLPTTRWQQAQRTRLVRAATDLDGHLDILPPPRRGEKDNPVGEGERWPRARINPAMMDIAFSGSPLNCREPTCGELRQIFDWKKHMSVEEASLYKYVVDVDGNGWSSRFKRLLNSNSVVFKSTIYPEWFTDRIQPWVHYVPISVDHSDLYDAFVFFRGDLRGDGNHDEMAEKIAAAGRRWTKRFWRKEDMSAYMFRLFLEYARVVSLEREAMTYRVNITHPH